MKYKDADKSFIDDVEDYIYIIKSPHDGRLQSVGDFNLDGGGCDCCDQNIDDWEVVRVMDFEGRHIKIPIEQEP